MSDRHDAIARAAARVAPSWTPEREHRVHARVDGARRALRRRQRISVVAFAAILAGVLSVIGARFLWPGFGERPMAHRQLPAVPAPLIRFEDGTEVAATRPDARLTPVEVRPEAVTVRLEGGGARFSVTPNPERVFRVMARDVTVTVLGTVFSVTLDKDDIRVDVERGRVRVEWPSGARIITAGEKTVVKPEPPAPVAAPTATEQAAVEEPAPEPSAPTTPIAAPAMVEDHGQKSPPTPQPSWRGLAEEGDYARAFAVLSADGASAVRDEPEDLLLAADVARLGGHPSKALVWLNRIVNAHGSDSRAPLAAFTLGRTLLEQLGRPREAAQAFATAQRLDPRGTLTQDALAREVESWSRAGDAATARERAETYAAKYPKGRRLQAVKRLGGLD